MSWRAADRFLLIALLYPIFAALLGWTFFEVTTVGGLEIAENGIPWPRRWGVIIILIAAPLAIYWIARNELKVVAFVNRKRDFLIDKLDHRPGLLSKTILWITRTIPKIGYPRTPLGDVAGTFGLAIFTAIYIAFAGTFFSEFIFAGAIAGAAAAAVFAVIFLFAGAFAFARAVAGAVTIASAGVGAIASAVFTQNYTLLLFFVLLPLCNALTDAMSITFTRYFLRNLQKSPSAVKIAFDLAADLIIALASLIILVLLMTTALDLWGARWPDTLPFHWRTYRAEILSGNWQAGTMLWLMTLTTLLPTLAHVIAGAMALTNAHRAERLAAGARLEALCDQIPLGTPYEDIPADLRRGELAAIKRTAAKPNFAGGVVAFLLAAAVLALSYAILWGLEELIWGSWEAFPKP